MVAPNDHFLAYQIYERYYMTFHSVFGCAFERCILGGIPRISDYVGRGVLATNFCSLLRLCPSHVFCVALFLYCPTSTVRDMETGHKTNVASEIRSEIDWLAKENKMNCSSSSCLREATAWIFFFWTWIAAESRCFEKEKRKKKHMTACIVESGQSGWGGACELHKPEF